MAPPQPVPVMLITGPVGVGKTAVGAEVSELLDQQGVAHAFVDIDSLRWCYPRPADDRFRRRLAMRNLAAVWRNFRDVGAQRLVLADVAVSSDELLPIAEAVPGAVFWVARLRASTLALRQRIEQRELGSGRQRHLERALELAAAMDSDAVADVTIETDGRSIGEIAHEVLTRSGWLQADG